MSNGRVQSGVEQDADAPRERPPDAEGLVTVRSARWTRDRWNEAVQEARPVRRGKAEPGCSIAISSGPEAAVGAEWCQMRGLIEQPESLPIIAGLPEVFRIDE